jgi:hypothetical protein
MLDELKVLRALRPDIDGPAPGTVERARSALSAEIDGEAGKRRPGWRHSRWLVPCFVVAMLGAGGLAAAGLSDWWTDADPPVRQAEAESLLAPATNLAPADRVDADLDRLRTVARAPGAALLAAPAKDSQKNYCIAKVPDGGEIERTCFGFEGDISNEIIESWVHEFDDATAWYLMGRLSDPGATRITLFEEMTYPLDVEGSRQGPDEPLSVEVGPGGFFLGRLPEEIWPSLELGYSSFSVLDPEGSLIRRGCLFLAAPPPSPHTEGLSRPVVEPGSDPEHPCPATGSHVTAATMRLEANVAGDWRGFAGKDLASQERVELASFAGRPVLALVVETSGYPVTTDRLLAELDAFAARHPEAQVVVLADRRRAEGDGMERLRTAKQRRPSLPILIGNVPWAAIAGRGAVLVALGPDGSPTAQLVPGANELLAGFPLVSQDLLDELLATTM